LMADGFGAIIHQEHLKKTSSHTRTPEKKQALGGL
jgi:hypothetical protein